MPDSALGFLEDELAQLVRVRGIDPGREGSSLLRELVEQVLDEYQDRAPTTSAPVIGSREEIAGALLDSIAGFGPLQDLMDDPDVEEIWINGPGKVFCARNGVRALTNLMIDPQHVKTIVERMLRASGRRVDVSSPFVDATLLDGSRLHVVIPDVTRSHWAVNIRKFVVKAGGLDELVSLGSISRAAADFLSAAVQAGANILVSGGTQTGKTTMLNCLAAAIPTRARVVTCEEVFELDIRLPDVVGMQTRQSNLEGEGEISLRRLIIEALRMRPDQIIVGEVRGAEALDLLIALNSGLPGMASIHANSARDALVKLSTLPLLAGENVTRGFTLPAVASSVDLVVHLGWSDGRRVTEEIVGVTGRSEGERFEAMKLFDRSEGELRWTGHQPVRPRGLTVEHRNDVRKLV